MSTSGENVLLLYKVSKEDPVGANLNTLDIHAGAREYASSKKVIKQI